MMRWMLFVVSIFLASQVMAESRMLSAPEAAIAVKSGDMILIDIRTPNEWAETGVAKGAIAITMHSPEFRRRITDLLSAQQDKAIGLICATGGRTEYVVSVLAENGFEDIIDVSEGMMGNARGPGWIAHGLPLTTSSVAQNAYLQLSTLR